MDMDQVREIIALTKEKDDLDIRLKQLTDRIGILTGQLLPQFIAENMKSIKIAERYVGIRRDIWPSPDESYGRAGLAAALREADLAQFVHENYDSQTIRSHVLDLAKPIEAECNASGRLFDEQALRDGLPEPLRRAMKITFKYAIRVTKTARG